MSVRFLTGQRMTADLLNDELIAPVCYLVQATAQTGWTTSVATAVTFASGSTSQDTDSIHNEASNPSRIVIGSKLGIWRISGVYVPATSAGSTSLARVAIGKNGSLIPGSFTGQTTSFTTIVHGFATPVIEVEATLSTDYVELFGTQTNGTTVGTAINTFAASSFRAEWIRHP